MALLPIAWDIDKVLTLNLKNAGRGANSKMKAIFDFPAARNLGTVENGTSFTLKLSLGEDFKQNWKAFTKNALCIEIERFCNLCAINIQGSVSLHEIATNKRVGFKTFQHSYKDGEKSFIFQMNIFRPKRIYESILSDLSLHGHICVDAPMVEGSQTNANHIIDVCEAFCPKPEIHKSFSLLSNDLQQMLQEHCFSDVTLNCDGEKFSAHKAVLSSRSPVFKAMFESSMKESYAGEIHITDMEPVALHALLKYMYCGKIDDLSDTLACDLLYAADKYDLPALKENCVSYLKTAIYPENVCLLLKTAVLHDESLKDVVFRYVFKNSSQIVKTEEWKALVKSQPHIYKDIFFSLSGQGSKRQKLD